MQVLTPARVNDWRNSSRPFEMPNADGAVHPRKEEKSEAITTFTRFGSKGSDRAICTTCCLFARPDLASLRESKPSPESCQAIAHIKDLKALGAGLRQLAQRG